MKTGKAVAFFMGVVLLISGCVTKSGQADHGATGQNMIEVLVEEAENAQEEETPAEETVAVTAPDAAIQNGAIELEALPESDVDVDLTKMSSTMVYARVLNLLTNPETYIGMTVRMQGKLSLYVDPDTDAHYFACIIADATACCAQGIEFERKGSPAYPEDYPELDEEVVVEGVFEIYEENGLRYVRLGDADMQLATAYVADDVNG